MAHVLRRLLARLTAPADWWRNGQRLRREQQFSRTLLESMPGVAYLFDRDGQYLRWNRNLEKASGFSSAEILQMNPLQFIADADKQRVAARIAQVFETGEASVEGELLAKDGSTKPYFFTGRRVQFDGRDCLAGAGIDLSAHKQAANQLAESERRYRELVEYANSIILRWNAEGLVTFINEFGQRFFGYSSEELLGKPVLGTIVPLVATDGRNLQELMQEICASPETFGANVNENMRRNGERVWIAWNNRIVRDAQGRVLELLSIGTDITERRRSEEKLRRLEEQFRRAQKLEAIGQLAGGVAHDFSNIVSAILGNIQLALADTAADHPARESMLEIEKSTQRARRLVRQILTFARHQPQERRVIDLSPSLDEAIGFLRSILPSTAGLTVQRDSATPLVRADSTQVYQAVVNLCTNAWHALEGRPGRIDVQLAPATLDEAAAAQVVGLRAGNYACISVADTGSGMDNETLEHIFEPFFTTREAGRGTGLGLPVVHGVMQGHDGAITVKSEPGKGTLFKLYFPAANGAMESPTALLPETRPGDGARILYLDDEEPLVFLATRMLTRLGYKVSGFTLPDEALRAVEADPAGFDLVVTDLNMPGTSGLQVAVELLKIRADLPVVLCSGRVTDELREEAKNVGIREVLDKPGTIEEFSHAIHRLVARID